MRDRGIDSGSGTNHNNLIAGLELVRRADNPRGVSAQQVGDPEILALKSGNIVQRRISKHLNRCRHQALTRLRCWIPSTGPLLANDQRHHNDRYDHTDRNPQYVTIRWLTRFGYG